MDFDTDYCLYCSRQTSGKSYCSQKCRHQDRRRSSFYIDDSTSSSSSAAPLNRLPLTSRRTSQPLRQQPIQQQQRPSMLPQSTYRIYDDSGIRSWRSDVEPGFGPSGPSTPSHHLQPLIYGPSSTPRPDFPLSRQRPAAPTLCTNAQGSLHAPRPVVTYTVSRVGSGSGFGPVGDALVRTLSPSLLAGPHPHPPQSPPPHHTQAYASSAHKHPHHSDSVRPQPTGGVLEGFARRLRSAWNQQRDSPSPARSSTVNNAPSSSTAVIRPLPQRPDGSRAFAKKPAEIRVMHETQVRDATPAGSLSASPPSVAASSTSLFLDASPLTLPPLAVNIHMARKAHLAAAGAAPISSSSTRARYPSYTPSPAVDGKALKLKPRTQVIAFPISGSRDDDDEDDDGSEDEAELKRRFPQIRRPTVIETLEECKLIRESPIAVRMPSAHDVPSLTTHVRNGAGVGNGNGARAKAIWIAGKKEEALSEFGPIYYDLSDSRTREPPRPVSPLACLPPSSNEGDEGRNDADVHELEIGETDGFEDMLGEELKKELWEEAWRTGRSRGMNVVVGKVSTRR